MPATLEERFKDALGRWKEHCRNNSLHSFAKPYLNCDAYREIVSMGVSSLPLICDQLHQEIETDKKYDDELKRLKIKVFGTDQVELFDDNYRKMCEDEEYQKCQKGYGSEIMGNPGQFWSYAVHEIVGDDFRIKVGEDSPVSPRVLHGIITEAKEDSGFKPGEMVELPFTATDVRGVMQFTLKWLNDNMHRYIPSHI